MKSIDQRGGKIRLAVRCACFLLLLFLITRGAWNLLRWKESRGIRQMYRYPKQTVDAAFLGSSHCYMTVNPAWLWEDHGIAACNVGESGQNLGTTVTYMKELLKTQKPDVIAVELSYFSWKFGGFLNGNIYRNTLGLRWSADYLDNLRFTVNVARSQGITDEYYKYILLKYPVVHSRYDELTEEDFTGLPEDPSFGRYEGSWEIAENLHTPKAVTDTLVSEEDLEYSLLDQMISLAEENDVRLVFWVAPFFLTDGDMRRFNAAGAYLKEKNIPFFNMNALYDEIGFDYAVHMRDESHVNQDGARLVTGYLGTYLKEECHLPDRRGQAGYELYSRMDHSWQQEVDLHEMEAAKTLPELMEVLARTDVTWALMPADQIRQEAAQAALSAGNEEISRQLELQGCATNAEAVYGGWRISDRLFLKSAGTDTAVCELLERGALISSGEEQLLLAAAAASGKETILRFTSDESGDQIKILEDNV